MESINPLFFFLLLAPPTRDQLIQIALFLIALVVVWVILRFVLRLAMRVFTVGCMLLLALGVLIVILQYLS